MRAPLALVLAITTVAVLASACRASDPPPHVPRSPLEERVTPSPTPFEAAAVTLEPGTGGLGSAAHPEGATALAIEYFASALGVPFGDLRLEGVTDQGTQGWRVTLRDAFDGRHTADVSAGGIVWVPQAQGSGTVALWQESARLLVLEVGAGALTLRVGRDAQVAMPPVGARVAFGYDPSPRGDGVPVLTWIVGIP